MADVLGGLGDAIENINKLAKDGVTITVEHEIETTTMYTFIIGMGVVALVLVVGLYVKDRLLRRT